MIHVVDEQLHAATSKRFVYLLVLLLPTALHQLPSSCLLSFPALHTHTHAGIHTDTPVLLTPTYRLLVSIHRWFSIMSFVWRHPITWSTLNILFSFYGLDGFIYYLPFFFYLSLSLSLSLSLYFSLSLSFFLFFWRGWKKGRREVGKKVIYLTLLISCSGIYAPHPSGMLRESHGGVKHPRRHPCTKMTPNWRGLSRWWIVLLLSI